MIKSRPNFAFNSSGCGAGGGGGGILSHGQAVM